MTTDTIETPAKVAQIKPRPTLRDNRVQVGYAGYWWSTYQCMAEEGHTLEDALRSDYWSHIATARRMRQFDVLEVRCEDGSWMADLVVTEAGAKHVVVKLIRTIEAEEVGEPAPTTVEVAWKGGVRKFALIRKADGEVVKDGIASKADAYREAAEYERRVA